MVLSTACPCILLCLLCWITPWPSRTRKQPWGSAQLPHPQSCSAPCQAPKVGGMPRLLSHLSGQFFCLCFPLMPFTLHLDIFQVHFDNNAQVKVMGKKLNLREPNIQPSREPNLKPFAAMSTSRDVREKKREGEWGLGRPCPQTWRGSSQDDCYCMALTVNPGDPASRAEMCLPWYWGSWKD